MQLETLLAIHSIPLTAVPKTNGGLTTDLKAACHFDQPFGERLCDAFSGEAYSINKDTVVVKRGTDEATVKVNQTGDNVVLEIT